MMGVLVAGWMGAVFLLALAPAFAGAVRPGFSSFTLARTDDGTTAPVSIGFTIDFLGRSYSTLHVNNNGNVTFVFSLPGWSPFDLIGTGRILIAPFFADVDTRAAGNPVTYGPGMVDGHPAFGVNWVDVDCFTGHAARSVRNSFQLVLIERSDTGPGNFDFELNYDRIQWETGQASGGDSNCLGGASSARAGFSNGTGQPGTAFELPGSGVSGAFLDDGPPETSLVHNSRNSDVLGRYRFAARNGSVLVDMDEDGDGIADNVDTCASTVLPEVGTPSAYLGVNHYADVDGDGVFNTTAPLGGGTGPEQSFTLADTGGCSCTQIIQALGLGEGARKYGCSIQVMLDWSARLHE